MYVDACNMLLTMVESGTMKFIMGASYSAARLPSAALLSWASLSGSELSELLLNFAQTQQNAQGSPLMFHNPTQHMRNLSTTTLPCDAVQGRKGIIFNVGCRHLARIFIISNSQSTA